MPHCWLFLQGIAKLRNYTILGFVSLALGIVLNLVLLRSFDYIYFKARLEPLSEGSP